MAQANRTLPAHFRELSGVDLRKAVFDAARSARTEGNTRDIFVLGTVNREAAEVFARSSHLRSIKARHGLSPRELDEILDVYGLGSKRDAAKAVEIIRFETLTPNWTLDFQVGIHHGSAAKILVESPRSRPVTTQFLGGITLLELLYHSWEGAIRSDARKAFPDQDTAGRHTG